MNILLFTFGLAVGSFLNVVIDRLPKGENIISGRSRCDHCGKTLRWFELIPLLSFVLQRGRCLRCGKQLSVQYPIVEMATALGFAFLYPSFSYILIFISLFVIFVADLKYQIIPDSMLIVGVVGVLFQGRPMWLAGFGASLFFLILFLITRGRGIGFGDVKLGFLMGLLLGFPYIVIALYIAFLTGATAGVILILGKMKTLKSAVPFGPFLIWGTVAGLMWGEKILALWQKIL